MKKFAYMLAALSLCAVSFVACDDDKDNNDPDRIHDYECSSDADCKDNANGKTECSGNVCVSPIADKDDCNSNDDCINNENGKVECNSSKKCDFPSDPSDEDACDAANYVPQCENGDAWVCKESKRVKEACGEGKECKEGQGCVEIAQDGECFEDKDCASKGENYFCNDSHMCEEKSAEAKDPCAGVECAAGSCDRGICVTDEMKALKVGDPCDPESFQSFCNGDKTMECNGNIVSDDCSDNLGKCTVVENIGKKFATCSGNEDMLARCAANESSASPKPTIDLCFGSQDWAAVIICTTDVAGNPSIYAKGLALDCEGKACNYGDGDAPVCAE